MFRLGAPTFDGIDSGHHMAEEAPDELAAALAAFFPGPAAERA